MPRHAAPPRTHVLGERSAAFRREFFPEATVEEWNDWRWQLRHRIKDIAGLRRIVKLSVDEEEAVIRMGGGLPVGITPYYAALMNPDDPADPIRVTMIPVTGEFIRTPGEADDPLAEDSHMPVEGLVHRYPDRVLFLVTNFCATYCRLHGHGRPDRRVPFQHSPVSNRDRLHRRASGNPRRPPLRRRSA